jgi:thiol-disulfide isomerase/thioredoxin
MSRALAVAGAVALTALLALTGCNADDLPASPGQAHVDVDTPALRQLKSEAAVEDCAPGRGADTGLPDLTLPCLGGGPEVDLASLEGPVILNLWASNCGPCRQEMPALQDFYEKYGDRVHVLGVDYQDRQPAAALELAKRSGVRYPLVADPGGDLNAADPVPVIIGIPYFVFLDADGDVSVAIGGVDSVDDL